MRCSNRVLNWAGEDVLSVLLPMDRARIAVPRVRITAFLGHALLLRPPKIPREKAHLRACLA